jgi:HPt (histidine-containing phosphotransfer) domain-containing protein
MEVPVLDRARLEDASAGDEEFLRELVDIYVEDAEERLAEIKEALISADEEALGRTAHQLKGSSANMGVVCVADHAKKMEDLAREHAIADAAEILPSLEHELGRARAALFEMAGTSV